MTAQPPPQGQPHVWYYQKSSLLGVTEEGPFTDAQLLRLAKDDQLTLVTPIRSPTRTKNQWIKAEGVQALAVAINEGRIDAEAKKRSEADERQRQKHEMALAKHQAKAEAARAKAASTRTVEMAEAARKPAMPQAYAATFSVQPTKPQMEAVLFTANPAMFKNDPVRFVVYCVLCLVLIGIPLLLIWWFTCKAERLTVTTHKTVQRKGLFSKHITEVWHRDVRNVQVHQSLFQRIFGVGTIAVSSAGQGGLEIEFSGVVKPERVKELIDSHR